VMPGMDDFEVIENLRKGNYDRNIKIIVFSNLSQKEDKEKARELGANGFIVKSDYTPNDLVKEASRLLNQFNEQKINEEKAVEKKAPVGEKSATGAKKILMMEDEDVFVEMFGGKLKQEGFEMEYAKNGNWGIKEAMKNKYDMFIIDMAMPVMSGDEVVERLKSDEELKKIPILILSASASDEDVKKVQALGVDKFFIKTQVTPSDLAKEVREILEK
jgi:CheY-like chemotaxis protein